MGVVKQATGKPITLVRTAGDLSVVAWLGFRYGSSYASSGTVSSRAQERISDLEKRLEKEIASTSQSEVGIAHILKVRTDCLIFDSRKPVSAGWSAS